MIYFVYNVALLIEIRIEIEIEKISFFTKIFGIIYLL